jgi:hypothetical protein
VTLPQLFSEDRDRAMSEHPELPGETCSTQSSTDACGSGAQADTVTLAAEPLSEGRPDYGVVWSCFGLSELADR